jgi:hypothetical protein
MLYRSGYLNAIRSRVASGRLSLTDAILSMLKICRSIFPDEYMRPLNRELLGYLPEEVESFAENLESLLASYKDKSEEPKYNSNDLKPSYRLLPGSWVSYAQTLIPTLVDQNSVPEEHLFYAEGIMELEDLLNRVSISDNVWVCVAADRNNKAAFMCTTKNLQSMYDLIRAKILDYLDFLMRQLRDLSASEQDPDEDVQLIFVLKTKTE